MSEPVKLYYWPHIPGRGEFVRLVLEQAQVPYIDVARLSEDEGGGIASILKIRRHEHNFNPGFAPPYLQVKNQLLAQSVNISEYLALHHNLTGSNAEEQAVTRQYALTIADIADDAHNTHHPLDVTEYYEVQKEAAIEKARAFREKRLPQYLGFLETVLKKSGVYLSGEKITYADLHLFQLLGGLEYAFPEDYRKVTRETPELLRVKREVSELPAIKEYLNSERRLDFNNDGLFRYYPELNE